MCIKGRPNGELTRAMRLVLACCLILLPICSHAQSGSQDTYVGNFYWHDPSHDKWVPTEFYAAASADSPVTRFTRKTRMQVVAARRGWLAIRPAAGAEATTIVFMPVGTFRFRLYKGKASSTFDERIEYALEEFEILAVLVMFREGYQDERCFVFLYRELKIAIPNPGMP